MTGRGPAGSTGAAAAGAAAAGAAGAGALGAGAAGAAGALDVAGELVATGSVAAGALGVEGPGRAAPLGRGPGTAPGAAGAAGAAGAVGNPDTGAAGRPAVGGTSMGLERSPADFRCGGSVSRMVRTTGGSIVDDADLTNSPFCLRKSSSTLLSTPSSFASS